MIDQGKKNLLGIGINAIDYEAAVAKIIAAAKAQQSMAVTALAVHGVMTGVQDATHGYRLNQLELVVPDGQPVRWGINILYGASLPDRVYGPTLTLKVCEQAALEKLPIYLYGSQEQVLTRLAENLRAQFPGLEIAGMQPSRFRQLTVDEKAEVVQTIKNSGAHIALVGLGCPRQEVWVYEHRSLLHMPMLAVGAAFDFHAGALDQAPPRLQQYGLEWFYRLTKEPKRLWKRYLFLNPYFLYLFALQSLKIQSFPRTRQEPPGTEMRYG